ncbi:hypothetical protein BJ138DRAFT_390970 [Hygrophoropsis aurantiaca]|uniref:Uncharacterized protein n=1 Tax=Hygrophoropsis aurantiaca TaxID=72124 RepID=A0ACB8A580_9AGAM|nr:hypothetical protein BJ138DRAFT_390970 [Hygrophoropsis aurantiaca]
MCNFIIPVRTCSKCHCTTRLFEKDDVRDGDSQEEANEISVYTDAEQDCYSRWCIYSSEHPKSCSRCWLTCKQWHGRTKEIHGGTASYVCYDCERRTRGHKRKNISSVGNQGHPSGHPSITTFSLVR